MKRFLIATTVAAATITTATSLVFAASLSLNIGHPDYYGRIETEGYSKPQLIESQAVTVERVSEERAPVYLRVPKTYTTSWKDHCGEYNACNERVYFVQDSWYNGEYVPQYQKRHHRKDD
ncbi:exported hypothetical protein [Gammaproteobacteria bacterium]